MVKNQMFCLPGLFCVDYKFIVVLAFVGLFVVFFGKNLISPQIKIIKEKTQPVIIQDRRQDMYERKVSDKLVEPSQKYVPERSYDPKYQMVGYLYREESDPNFQVQGENKMTLFGRRNPRNQHRYDYYVIPEKSDIKIQLTEPDRPREELMDGDKLSVSGYSGQFTAEIYEYNNLGYYNPFRFL
jgi:hypothetical protein